MSNIEWTECCDGTRARCSPEVREFVERMQRVALASAPTTKELTDA
jgi:hypothetical protein